MLILLTIWNIAPLLKGTQLPVNHYSETKILPLKMKVFCIVIILLI